VTNVPWFCSSWPLPSTNTQNHTFLYTTSSQHIRDLVKTTCFSINMEKRKINKTIYMSYRQQEIWVLGSTPTWICLLIFPKLVAVHFTMFITFFISGSSSRGSILNSYCKSLLYCIPDCQIMKLQRVMNISARLYLLRA